MSSRLKQSMFATIAQSQGLLIDLLPCFFRHFHFLYYHLPAELHPPGTSNDSNTSYILAAHLVPPHQASLAPPSQCPTMNKTKAQTKMSNDEGWSKRGSQRNVETPKNCQRAPRNHHSDQVPPRHRRRWSQAQRTRQSDGSRRQLHHRPQG